MTQMALSLQRILALTAYTPFFIRKPTVNLGCGILVSNRINSDTLYNE